VCSALEANILALERAMTIARLSFTAFLAGTSTPVDYFQPSDLGETFDFVMTFAEREEI
jgi:hypothetical protein